MLAARPLPHSLTSHGPGMMEELRGFLERRGITVLYRI